MAINISDRKPNCSARARSHALNTTNRSQKLNLQVVRLEDGRRVRLTTKEKRSLLKDVKNVEENVKENIETNTEE